MKKYNIIFGESALGTFRQSQRLVPALYRARISFCDDLSIDGSIKEKLYTSNKMNIISINIF
jgi:hypothetical protein